MDFDGTRAKLRAARELAASGSDSTAIRRALATGAARRVHRGWYVATTQWDAAFAEERHLMQVMAVVASMRGGDVVMTGCSAGVLWDLPLFRHVPGHVSVAGAGGDGSANTAELVARHRVDIPADQRTLRFGIACTTLERTVVDIAREIPVAGALACADAAMRIAAWDASARSYDTAAAEAFRERLWRQADAQSGARGIRRARFVIAFADGRAESPGESVSRLYFHQLGFAAPRLQVEISGPRGQRWQVDFGLDDVRAWGECDGKAKYSDPRYTGGRAGAQILDEEKQREDWIRGTTGRRFPRWGLTHLDGIDVFEARLRAFGIQATGARRPVPR